MVINIVLESYQRQKNIFESEHFIDMYIVQICTRVGI